MLCLASKVPNGLAGCLLFGALLAMCAPAGANDLLDTYHLAQRQDQTFQAALHQRDASIEAKPQAWSYLLPQISAQYNWQRDRLHVLDIGGENLTSTGGGSSGSLPPGAQDLSATAFYTTKGYALNLTQTLFNWSQFEAVAQADKQVAEAAATLHSAEQSLVYRTAQAYFNVLNTADALRSDLDAQSAFKEQLDQAQKKFEVGLAAVTDVRNAQASYDTASATVIADGQTLDAAKHALGVIVGKRVIDVNQLQADIPLAAPEPALVDDWTEAAAKDNPDIMSAHYAAEAARKQVAVNEGQFLPTVSLGGTLDRQDALSEFGDDTLTDAIGVTVNWNVFQGGLTLSQVRQAKASFAEALAQYELQRRSVDQAARDAFEGVMSGIAGVKANKQAVISNQTSVDATEVGLRVGTRNEIDLLNARQALAAAQRSYYQSRYTYLTSVLQLKQQAGRLSEADLANIDRMLTGAPATPPTAPPEVAAAGQP
jgi:outer membrane protein